MGHAVAVGSEILTAMVFVSEKWRGKLCNGPALSGEGRGRNYVLTDVTEKRLDREVFIERALAREGSKGGLVATER